MNNYFSSFFSKNEVEIRKWAIYLGIFVTIAGLAFMAYLGFYNRYWSDDWCYNVDFKNLGIGGTVNTYFMTGDRTDIGYGYSNNRYSLTLLSGLLYMAGIFGAKITATLVIGSWLISLLWLLSNLAGIFQYPSKNVLAMGAVVLLYYTLYLSPQRFQVAYWIAGIHYSFSIITGLYLAGLITYQIARGARSKIADFITFPLAFLAGGFSETGCAYLLSGAALALFITFYWRQKRAAWALRAFPTLLIAFLGLTVSLAALVSSPSNIARLDIIARGRPPLLITLLTAFRFSAGFMFDSLKSVPLPHFVIAATFLSLSILAGTYHGLRAGLLWESVVLTLAVTVFVWILISASQAPSVYIYNTPPDPRGQSLGRFTMLAGLAVIAWISGQAINFKWQNKIIILLALLGLGFNVVYTVRAITRTYTELPGFIHRANLWDQRDADIRNAREQGTTKMEVIVIDMKDVGVKDIMQSRLMDEGWVSSCASRYYGLEAIKAIAP
jgi:hypothetical protein